MEKLIYLNHSLLIGIFIVGFLAIIASMFDKKDKKFYLENEHFRYKKPLKVIEKDKEFVVMLNSLELKIK